jgi:hypothetical protein
MTPQRFELYPEERHWWSFNDYQAVLDAMRRTGAREVLEFGPGSSTLALIEGGAATVDAFEDDDSWAAVYEERLAGRFPDVVRIHRYVWSDPLQLPQLARRTFDLALIDGPRGTARRHAVLHAALACSRWVLMPVEDQTGDVGLRAVIQAAAWDLGVPVEITETGPLSGHFALVGPVC